MLRGPPPGPYKVTSEIRLLPETREAFHALAKRRGVTLSSLVEDWIARETGRDA